MSLIYPTGDTLSPVTRYVRLTVPEDMWVVAMVRSLLLQQSEPEAWYPTQGVTQQDAAAAFAAIEESVIEDYQETAGMLPPGTIVAYANYDPPDGWLACDGTEYLRADYPGLSAILPLVYLRPDDKFVTPDLRERFVIGAKQNLTAYPIGQYGGENHINLTTDQLAPHQHSSVGQGFIAEVLESPGDPGAVEVVRSDSPNDFTGVTGMGQDVPIIPPFHALQYIIKT